MIVIEDQARSIFLAALEREPDEWPAYLDEVCADNADLRARVNELLEAHQAMGTIHGGRGHATAIHQPPLAEGPGTVIGPYKLLQQIGEGGMGVVFMAEQTEPIQRTVALKIIKPGMDTRQVIARFEAERQALAMMEHPNIAKVLDAGTTETGRPYFVMELVKGVPITKYCDDKQLSLRQRLELFKLVCEAVQHAHQKGIIHRDIKPTNVLVAEYDNRAVPKVIDFGVAKATAQKLTERTMFTEFGQVIGTVEYMSPEQAKLNQLDIDTRSDIYSLGVLLYELLTGSTPFERQRLRDAALDEVLRIIREEEPAKPSTRLSTSDTLPSIAANRHTEPARLSKDVRGELDWIVMKCLEKDRNRRYETASGLAADINRYLHDEPVEAKPATQIYRLKKFVQRNKTAVSAASAIIAALALGLALATTGFIRARNEAARSEETAQFLKDMLKAAGLQKESKLVVLNRLFDDSLIRNAESKSERAKLLRMRGTLCARIGYWEEGVADCLNANKIALDGGVCTFDSAIVLLKSGHQDEYRKTCHVYLERTGNSPDFITADMAAKVSLLLPVSDEDFDRACKLADFAATETEPGWHVACVRLGKALAEYRRGELNSAIDWTSRAISSDEISPRQKAAAYLIQALTYASLRKMELGRSAFDNGDALLRRRRDAFTYEFGDTWCDLTIADMLRSEAAQELGVTESSTTVNSQPVDIPTPNSNNPTPVTPPTTEP